MAELPRELHGTPDAAPAFFRLGQVNNSRVKDVLHQIQKNGMEDPRSAHQLLSLFQPEEFTDDVFHVLSPTAKPQTLWDQVAQAASNPKKLTIEQKGALTSLKYFALQSLAEDPQEHAMRGGQTRVLNESARDAAKTELRKYDAYLAKTLDPEDFASARFFDTANVAGKVAGKVVKAGGTLYLMSNLIGCSFGGTSPTSVELPTLANSPAITETVPIVPAMTETPTPPPTATAEPTQTETPTQVFTKIPTPTETPTPALVPILGPLPSNNDPQLPFPGYKEENYTVGWNSLKDDWNRLWTKWQLMAADQLGPGGSLVVRPVEGEAGIDCEDAVDGSYKGMTLCPPLDLVNGGFLPFPGIDVAANTDYYPLFIQRSSQYARLKSVGTGTSLVLQEIDSQGKPTRYIKPKNDVNGKGGVWVAGEYVAPIEYPATVSILSSEQLAEKHLYGSGFEIKTEFQGIPVDLTGVTSNATLAQYKQTRGCMPNQEMKKYGASAEDRMAEMVFWGHYVGYLRDRGLKEANYPFKQYLADLTAGKDRSYMLWGVGLDQSIGEFRVNPLAPVEYVTTNAVVDPDGNGRGIGLHGDNISRLGYQQLENGGVRIVEAIRSDYKNYPEFCDFSGMDLSSSLIFLGLPLEFLKGDIPIIYGPEYPIAVARIGTIWFDDRIWKDSNGLLRPGVLVP